MEPTAPFQIRCDSVGNSADSPGPWTPRKLLWCGEGFCDTGEISHPAAPGGDHRAPKHWLCCLVCVCVLAPLIMGCKTTGGKLLEVPRYIRILPCGEARRRCWLRWSHLGSSGGMREALPSVLGSSPRQGSKHRAIGC